MTYTKLSLQESEALQSILLDYYDPNGSRNDTAFVVRFFRNDTALVILRARCEHRNPKCHCEQRVAIYSLDYYDPIGSRNDTAGFLSVALSSQSERRNPNVIAREHRNPNVAASERRNLLHFRLLRQQVGS